MRLVDDLLAAGEIPHAAEIQRDLVAGLERVFGVEHPDLMRARTTLWRIRERLAEELRAEDVPEPQRKAAPRRRRPPPR
jgi:hypothetical protein